MRIVDPIGWTLGSPPPARTIAADIKLAHRIDSFEVEQRGIGGGRS